MANRLLVQTFKNVGENVWFGLENAKKLNLSLGETTITEMMILYLESLNLNEIQTTPTSIRNEPKFGTDWEWRIGNDNIGWIQLFIQAKKLDKYYGFGYKVKSKNGKNLQIDILNTYAKQKNASPFYILYNFYDIKNYIPFWHCHDNLKKELLGVTINSSENINYLRKQKNMGMNFENTHSMPSTLPLYCFLKKLFTALILQNTNTLKHIGINAIYETLSDLKENQPSILLKNIDTPTLDIDFKFHPKFTTTIYLDKELIENFVN